MYYVILCLTDFFLPQCPLRWPVDIADSNNSHQVSNLSKCTKKIDKKVDKNDFDIPDFFVSSIRYAISWKKLQEWHIQLGTQLNRLWESQK